MLLLGDLFSLSRKRRPVSGLLLLVVVLELVEQLLQTCDALAHTLGLLRYILAGRGGVRRGPLDVFKCLPQLRGRGDNKKDV